MPKHELIKSLEREGFSLIYPDSLTNEEKIVEILKEDEERLLLAIPLLLEHNFNYEKIRKDLLKLKEGQKLLKKLNKIILIAEKIFKNTKRSSEILTRTIEENGIKEPFSEKEFEYYLEWFKESKRELERKNIETDNLERRKSIDALNSLEKIFSPGKLRILRKIYEYKELTPTEKMYYYRDIKPLIDAALNKNLQEYLGIVKGIKGRKSDDK